LESGIYKFEIVIKMIISLSVWMTPVDTSV